MKYKKWALVDWNPVLGLKCWRKSFKRGYVSIGVGDFTHIVYSYGHDSEDSLSSTRWRAEGPISERETMRMVDKQRGHYRHYR